MWSFLASLNPWFSYSIVVLALLALVIISLKGKLFVQWGKDKVIGVGKGDEKKDGSKPVTKTTTTDSSFDAFIIPSCSDCIKLVISMREKMLSSIDKIENHILKDQMNFCEQKIAELKSIMLDDFSKLLSNKSSPVNENLRYEMFRSLLYEVIDRLKSEIRRSLKENGFYEFGEGEFNNYLSNRYNYLETLAKQHYENRYLAYSSVLPQDLMATIFKDNENRIEALVREMYAMAKAIKTKTIDDKSKTTKSFYDEVDTFVKSRKGF